METVTGFWSDITSLRSVSAWFQWVSIGLVFFSGLLQLGKFLVDRRERALTAIAQGELVNPAAQPIRTGTVTIEVVAESNDQVNTTFMDRGGYVAFGRGTEALMVLSATESRARQTGQGDVIWHGVFNMDATDPSVGKPVRFLRDAEFLQVQFVNLPAKSKIKRGLAVVTINSAVRLEIPVPEQQMPEDKIIVPQVGRFLSSLK